MDYGILGALELSDGSAPLALSGARQRTLLAVLLLHRNEVVSSERLIDDLWGDAPPATAAKALQNAVSQLRRVLANGGDPGPGPLRTVHGGYVLDVAEGELDADRFERLFAAGRAALDDGDPAVAAENLHGALAIWRGPPLADVAYEGFAQPEIARLDEQRLSAVEERIDAELALGRHADLVAELEEQAARHPLRERLRGQLMLALYRSGRQADALEAFQVARNALVAELGIEPGPALRELQAGILSQDPALDPPSARRRTVRAAPRPGRGRVRVLLAGAALLLLASAAAAGVVATRGEAPARVRLTSVPGNSLVAIDLHSGQITGSYPAGSTPTSVAAGAGATWALNADDGTLTRVDMRTSAPRTFGVPETALDLAAGPAGVFALTGDQKSPGGASIPDRVLELVRDTGDVLRTIDLPHGDDVGWFSLDRIALGRTTLWAIGADDRLLRLDPRAPGAATVVPGVEASGVAVDGNGAWAITQGRESLVLVRISARARITGRVPVAATDLDGLAAGAGALWVTAPEEGLLWRVTPGTSRSIDVGSGARGVAVAGGSVWVANAARGTVTRVDPRTNRVTAVVRVGNAPRALATDGRRLWVSVAAGAGGAPARDAARAASGAVTAPACGGVIAGARPPERLIVSDLPLHQAGIGPLPDAIAFVLRRHAFRAGRFAVGYQSCDDSTLEQGGFEPAKCRANAALYARTPRVIGIVGPYHSDCATEQLAITNRAPGGPLATISPSNTAGELTMPVPGGRPGRLAQLYPTGRRHYVRLVGADDGQGAALAQYAHARGIKRLAIVRDDDDYGRTVAWYARRTARESGVHVLGPYRIDLDGGAARARALGGRIARARPDALLYAGVPDGGPLQREKPGFALVREVSRQRGGDLLILGPDSWATGSTIVAGLGRVARAVRFTYPGVPLERLGPVGRRFVADFSKTQPGGFVTTDAVYVAQATEVLLDAIARSDGSRASVTRALLATDVKDGLIGDVRFDAAGDIRPRPYAIARVSRRASAVPGVGIGADLEAIVSPP